MTKDEYFNVALEKELVWIPAIGMGYYNVRESDMPYDAEYFARYRRQADTPIGRALTKARIELVARHYRGPVLDVGVGAGQFVVERDEPTFGYDVNPVAAEWLQERGLFQDMYAESFRAMTFWDSLEHIPDAAAAVARSGEWVFTSLPIYEGPEHVLRSKHFRRDEHCWYHTDSGLRRWFERQGFECVEHNIAETDLGREDIGSYAFRRIE